MNFNLSSVALKSVIFKRKTNHVHFNLHIKMLLNYYKHHYTCNTMYLFAKLSLECIDAQI